MDVPKGASGVIKQSDNHEKNHQVRQMRNIYLNASQVILLLGEHPAQQTDDMLDIFKDFSKISPAGAS